MALFSLTDIQFNVPGVRRGVSQLTEDSRYGLNTFRYPEDLGSVDKGHYMVININEQVSTSFSDREAGKLGSLEERIALSTIKQSQQAISSAFGSYITTQNAVKTVNLAVDALKLGLSGTALGDELNKVKEKILNPSDAGLTGQVVGGFLQNIEKIGVRSVRRITDTIALYMPDTLNFDYDQQYSELTPGTTNPFLSGTLSAGAGVAETLKAGGSVETIKANLAKTLSPFAFRALTQSLGDVGKILFTAGTGGAVSNPMLELIYSSPQFRSFRFDFLLYPRSQREAIEVNNILNRLRFHQAPELVKNTGGAFLYPPSEFDISFYYNGKINPNIPRISTCVLTNIQTDYAPNGFAAYEVPGRSAEVGGTGMPVAIRLSLTFKETEYLVKGSPTLGNQLTKEQENIRASQAGEFGTS